MRISWLSKKSIITLIILFALDLALFILYLANSKIKNPLISIILSLILLFLAIKVIKKMIRYDKGGEGEYVVAKELKKLPHEFHFLSDFNYNNRKSADFVVIGPTGIFTIEVKNYKTKEITQIDDKLFGDGKEYKKSPINQAYSAMKNLQEYLIAENIDIPINPIVVFTNPYTKIRFGKNKIKGVNVIGLKWLNKLILEQYGTKLTNQECIKLKEVIKKYTSLF